MDSEVEARLAALAQAGGGETTLEDASAIWSRLIQHQMQIVLTFSTDQREYLIMVERSDGPPALSGRNLAILEMVLIGAGRKVVSYDLGLSPSTIAQILKTALQDMGLSCSPARVPSLLVKIAHTAGSAHPQSKLPLRQIATSTSCYWVLSDELDSPVLARLAPAQRAVLRQIICGSSYADIAVRRQTSYRTVANQVASACQALGVSGRFSLLQRVSRSRGTTC
jgi:DNA-binding NarL/FixJ family response regulator